VQSIVSALTKNGCDKDLLKKAVAAKHFGVIRDLLDAGDLE
jgi:hypothetical protein